MRKYFSIQLRRLVWPFLLEPVQSRLSVSSVVLKRHDIQGDADVYVHCGFD